jgi:hypothetical protein
VLCGDWWRVVSRGKGSKCVVLEVAGDVIVFLVYFAWSI